MSSLQNQLGPEQASREVQLVAKILGKTRAGRIIWHRFPSSISAITQNAMQFDFILNAPILLSTSGQSWVTFTVRDQNVEVLKVQRPVLGPMPGMPQFYLVRAVEALFNEAIGTAQDHVGRAITKVDQL